MKFAVEKQDQKKIEEIIGQIYCPKDFKCAASGFEDLCKAEDIGVKHHLLCLESAPSMCRFSLEADGKYYCACPLRVYLAKHIGR